MVTNIYELAPVSPMQGILPYKSRDINANLEPRVGLLKMSGNLGIFLETEN